MSLTGRLTAFFLLALAVVLAGFSAALYLLARSYFYGELDARLDAALATLAAAAEVEEDRIEWDPAERALTLGRGPDEGQPRWVIQATDGRTVDRSPNAREGDFPVAWQPDRAGSAAPADGRANLGGWRLAWRRLTPRAAPRGELDDDEYPAVVLTAGLPVGPAQAALWRLGVTVAGLSAVLWVVAALFARRLSRRTLAPVARMAESAAQITAEDLGRRLPSPGTGDELEELCRTFNDLLGRLQESFEQQRRFTGDASHQLRTPLTVLLGQVEVAQRRERTPAEYQRVLDAVHGEGVRMRQVVEALLFLARTDADGLRPGFEELDLTAWVPEQLRRWAGRPRGTDLDADVPGGAPLPVRAHSSLLAHALDNLLENACKYSEPDTPIAVRAWASGGEVHLAVADRGWGLTAEDLPLVFEPFFRARHARRSGQAGVGLGLAVVRRIAAVLGGTVTVTSEPGRGSQFTLHLPVAPGRTEAREPVRASA